MSELYVKYRPQTCDDILGTLHLYTFINLYYTKSV